MKEDRGNEFDAAHLTSDQASEGHIPSIVRSWNSKDGLNSITRSGLGIYAATLPEVFHPDNGGTVSVTAFGEAPNDAMWPLGNIGSNGTSVTVVCFNPDGSPADSQFVLSFSTDVAFGDSTLASQYGGFAQSARGIILPEFREYSNADFTAGFERAGTGFLSYQTAKPRCTDNRLG